MKKILFALLALFASYAAYAQGGMAKKVDASLVPQVVKDAQAANHSNSVVDHWEFHGAKGKNHTWKKYVAVFREENQKVRARYSPEGKPLSASTYYAGNQLPAAIQSAVIANYNTFTVKMGEKIKSYKTGKEFYRILLNKGSQKLTVFLDSEGKEVTRNKVPEGVEVEEVK